MNDFIYNDPDFDSKVGDQREREAENFERMKKTMTQEQVLKVISGERNYQDRMVSNPSRPDMIEDFHVGDGLTAINYNLKKAEEAWYKGAVPHTEAMEYLRKIAGIVVQLGERYGLPERKG